MAEVRTSRRKSTIMDFVFDAAATPTAPELGGVMKSHPFSRKLERRENSVASNARGFVYKSFAKILSRWADGQAAMRLRGDSRTGVQITYTDVRQQDASCQNLSFQSADHAKFGRRERELLDDSELAIQGAPTFNIPSSTFPACHNPVKLRLKSPLALRMNLIHDHFEARDVLAKYVSRSLDSKPARKHFHLRVKPALRCHIALVELEIAEEPPASSGTSGSEPIVSHIPQGI
ncbi:hypothetical protein K438DRAFT_1771551 [Mycena galopus ATCC 62051]|nr:hypothetical protein K438DRAFT_1771551 [Mycena galopus ATCC 62051]